MLLKGLQFTLNTNCGVNMICFLCRISDELFSDWHACGKMKRKAEKTEKVIGGLTKQLNDQTKTHEAEVQAWTDQLNKLGNDKTITEQKLEDINGQIEEARVSIHSAMLNSI